MNPAFKRSRFNKRRRFSERRHCAEGRDGIACTETALLLPILVVTTLCIVDICNVLHLRQKVATIAFEAARASSADKMSFGDAERVGHTFAQARRVNNASIRVAATNPRFRVREQVPIGERINSRVTAPVRGNVIGPFLLFRGTQVSSPFVTLSAH